MWSPIVASTAQTRTDEGSDRKSTRLNSSHLGISYAVFCLKKKKINYAGLTQTVHPSVGTGDSAQTDATALEHPLLIRGIRVRGRYAASNRDVATIRRVVS